jgi:hypothetical protein
MEWKEHYALYKEGYLERNKKKREASNRLIREAKNKPCADCGVKYPYYVMDLDHIEGQKTGTLAHMKSYSEKRVQEEINKCEAVCSNCHRIRTFNRNSVV